MVYNIETDNKVCVRRDARGYEVGFGLGVRSKISDWGDRQRELRAPVFLPDDRRNQHPSPESSDAPPLRYGETEFSYERHQERPELRNTSAN